MSEMLARLARFSEMLAEPFVGREEEAKVITLGLLSREHVLLVGEPGTAKSAIARRAAELLEARFFKYLLTRFTEPSELFGPLDIEALKRGKYRRITAGKLPEAEIAFLDEIFNANSAILNSLLSIMQERVLYDGYAELHVPLWSLIAASNRIPDEPELEALYDRMLLRHRTKPLSENKWAKLLEASWRIEMGAIPPAKPVLTLDDLSGLHRLLFKVDLSQVKPKLLKLYAVLEERGIHLTDRRKGKALKIIAAQALLEGRMTAEESDLLSLKYVAPRDVEDFDKVEIILSEELRTPERFFRELTEIGENVQQVAKSIKSMGSYDPSLIDIYRSLRAARSRVSLILRETDDIEVRRKGLDVIRSIDEILDEISRRLGI